MELLCIKVNCFSSKSYVFNSLKKKKPSRTFIKTKSMLVVAYMVMIQTSGRVYSSLSGCLYHLAIVCGLLTLISN